MKTHYLSDQHQYILSLKTAEYIDPKHRQAQIENCLEITKNEHRELHETMNNILPAMETLSLNQERIKLEASNIKTIIEQNQRNMDELKKQSNENKKPLEESVEKQSQLQTDMNNIKQATGKDPVLILDKDCTATLPFNSPNTLPFSLDPVKIITSKYGYPFTIRLCSTNESNRDYLSIFLTLHRGKYDNLIPYPFKYNIHFILWDQSNQQNHIEYILKPDANSSSFARPIQEKNDEYGIIKFCLLEYLTDTQSIYVKDGIFFIRVFVDILNTGKNPFQTKSSMDNTEMICT
ncbi:unnamed protein product [Adineta steineri]|uniref:TRAF1-6 MATH domain-containing protein n=1 Tax=Adineta steineri TaxID=433720 RepID=A0A814YIP4_9BILA|nr:unnamed protein product [Adineta steineri]CAF1230071.1 unnamed protein product [Adineta steineri]CAF1302028.1 unnamed protein product [Adineta steineri]